VLCAPAECSVQINNGSTEVTKGGRWERQEPPGAKVIDLKRDGYLSEQREVALGKTPATVSVTLKPNAATRQTIGREVFARLLKTMGGAEAPARLAEASTATGTIRIHAGGAPEEANLSLLVNGKLSSVRWNESEAVLNCSGDQCKVDEKSGFLKKKKKASFDPETEKSVRAFRRFNWTAYMSSLLQQAKAELKPYADSIEPDSEGRLNLVLQSDADTYTLELGADSLPHVISYHSRIPGMQGDVRVAYSAFQNNVPMQTLISFPGSKDAGIDVRFSRIEKGANLNPKDFPR